MKHPTMPRRRIQRAFCQWLKESRASLAIPVIVHQRRAGYIECRLTGISPALKIMLSSYDIVVAVEINGACWELLACFDAAPSKCSEGYVCTLCDPLTRPTYPSREALWRDELFEPLRNWINDTLASSEWGACYQIGNGATWAKIGSGPVLVEPVADHLQRVFPLWLEKRGQPGLHT